MTVNQADFDEAIRLLREYDRYAVRMPATLALTTTAFLARYSEAPKLKPCPFCGAVSVAFQNDGGWGGAAEYRGICTMCGARGPACNTKPAAIEAWNRRAG